ncbi:MAG TPA: hypothetical protein VLC09_19370 [Polyangiaceae bacterium]|nr:hypothetical protein [Polyangiaceae bacterium]
MCKLSQLAARGPFRVDVCEECGCVHLHLGAVSIRLDDNALGALATVIEEARGANFGALGASDLWSRTVAN